MNSKDLRTLAYFATGGDADAMFELGSYYEDMEGKEKEKEKEKEKARG